ncbi:ribosome maturation factor RimP [Pseudalkalibacillus decolorationis]|uniref:ribosome maturation factor RimP n=1 Tax=Pseudalkalibacillus decolorationis TaxID=163879 RepID=UPI0021475CB5|nr:ribosome maturation factor RimP [Pseudalkalibacillus decolorationis]
MSKKVTEIAEELVIPILESMNLELVDVEFVKEGKNWFLRVYIDSDEGVDIEECGKVSEQLGGKLDELDPIQEAYFLEVSSPGVERPLKKEQDIRKAIGKLVHIKTYEQIEGQKEFEGTLVNFDGNDLTIEIRVKTRIKSMSIPYDKVANARLAVSF